MYAKLHLGGTSIQVHVYPKSNYNLMMKFWQSHILILKKILTSVHNFVFYFSKFLAVKSFTLKTQKGHTLHNKSVHQTYV